MGQGDEVTQYGCWVSLELAGPGSRRGDQETGQKPLVLLLGALLLGWYAETFRTS